MSLYNYEPEEFARARYWQEQYMDLEKKLHQMLDEAEERFMKLFCKELEKKELRLLNENKEELFRLNDKITELEIRLEDHREEMRVFNLMPWYERLFHKFDLNNI